MKKEGQNIEGLFSDAFAEHTLVPDAKVLKSLRFKLWKTDFFSLNFRKFNAVYASLLIGITTALTVSTLNKPHQPTSQNNTIAIEHRTKAPKTVILEETSAEAALPEIEKDETTPIQVENTTAVAIAMFEMSSNKGCAPLIIEFDNLSVHASSYKWDFGDGEYSNAKTPIHEYKESGNYTAVLTINDSNNNSQTFNLPVEVFEKPISDFTVDIEKSDMETRNIAFLNKSTGANSYIWEFGDKSVPVSGETVNHIYTEYKTYSVKLIATSKDGCKDTLVVNNKFIDKNYILSFPPSFRPDRTGASNKGYYGATTLERSIFYPQNNGVQEYAFAVYAPNGIKVFETNDILQGWNGFYKGRMMPSGVYSFNANGVYPNGQEFNIKNNVKVIVENFHDNY